MPNFFIDDLKAESISNFLKISGLIKFEDIEKLQPAVSKYPVKVFIKAKRIGSNDFYYSRASIHNDGFKCSSLLFQASISLPGNNKNYKIWVEVFSEQYSLGTNSEELNFNVY